VRLGAGAPIGQLPLLRPGCRKDLPRPHDRQCRPGELDSIAVVSLVEVSTDSGGSWVLADGTVNGAYTWTLPSENGITHTLLARASSISGWVGTSEPVTVTVDTLGPVVVSVDREDGNTSVQLEVPLLIEFNETVDPASLGFSVVPDPGGWSVAWDEENTRVMLEHANGFSPGIYYKVSVTVIDPVRNGMTAPYTWSFWPADMEVYLPLILR